MLFLVKHGDGSFYSCMKMGTVSLVWYGSLFVVEGITKCVVFLRLLRGRKKCVFNASAVLILMGGVGGGGKRGFAFGVF